MSTSTDRTALSDRRRKVLLAKFLICLGVIGLASWLYPRAIPEFEKRRWGGNAAYYNRFLDRLPNRVRLELESHVTSVEDRRRLTPPEIEPEAGRWAHGTKITANPTRTSSIIRYTLDGSIPTHTSPKWRGDLTIEAPVLLRARAFARMGLSSQTVTRMYVTGVDLALPVLSIAIDPVHLEDARVGIIANSLQRGRMWERRAILSLFPAGRQSAVDCEVAIRVHGGASRRAPRKRFRIYTRQTDPVLQLELRQIVGEGADVVQTWVLHHPASITQLYRERLGNRLARAMGLPAPPAAPCIVLVNGKPWGVYDLMARVDARLVAGRTDVSGVTLLRGSLALPNSAAGSAKDWNELHQFIEENDLRDDEAYEIVQAAIDLDNVTDYFVFAIFSADLDRPHGNMEIFRDLEVDQRWRFMVYDYDQGFNYHGKHVDHDTFSYYMRDRVRQDLRAFVTPDTPLRVHATVLFRKLLAREDYRRQLHARFEFYLNGVLSPEQTQARFDQILREMEPFRELELSGYPNWEYSVAEAKRELEVHRIREFLDQRPGVLRQLMTIYLETADELGTEMIASE